MSHDTYAFCPCGSGQKIKFCCAKDIVADLDRVDRAIEGKQKVAALEMLNRLIGQRGKRPALLAMKAELLMSQQAEQVQEELIQTVADLLEADPRNPIGLCVAACLDIGQMNVAAAIEKIQLAMETSHGFFSESTIWAFGGLIELLLELGQIPAALAHLSVLNLVTKRDTRISARISELRAAPEVPVLFKENYRLTPCPEGVPWGAEFAQALELANGGAWLGGLMRFLKMAERLRTVPAILRNIAILHTFLAHQEQAAVAWRRYAALVNVPLDEAVEAEALSQFLAPPHLSDNYDHFLVSYPVRDANALQERLLSDRRVASMKVDLAELAENGEPPPKAAFWLLDRPVLPATPEDTFPLESIPNVLGELFLFGRQTDRDARLEFSVVKAANFELTTKLLAEACGEQIGPSTNEVLVGQVPVYAHLLTWRWRMPPEASGEVRERLTRERRREAIVNVWPTTALAVLDGKRPVDVAGDAAYRVRLLGAWLRLELLVTQSRWEVDGELAELRAKLGLPVPPKLTGGTIDPTTLPMARFCRVDVTTLADQQLLDFYTLTAIFALFKPQRAAITEMLNRPSLNAKVDRATAYEALARCVGDPHEALEFVHKAREAGLAKGASPARWLIQELGLRYQCGEAGECERLVQVIGRRHIREPGVAEALQHFLKSIGMVPQAGQGMPPGAEEAAAPAAPQAAAASAPSKLWVPGGDAPPAPEGKSRLILPGM